MTNIPADVDGQLDLKGVLRSLDEFGPTLDKANDHLPDLQKVGDGVTQPTLSKVLNEEDRIYLQRKFMRHTPDELLAMYRIQQEKPERGVAFGEWSFASGHSMALMEKLNDQTAFQRALDTSGGAALIRQDLEPILYALFVKVFPTWDRIPKEPANGVVHTWQQITSYGDAQFIPELGTVVDDTSAYVRATTNIAVLGTRRGVSFKEQLAVTAGGMSWNAQRLEIEQGITAMAHKMQKTIFQGQATNSGGTANNELGAYDANGFTGLRSILNTVRASNANPYFTSSPTEITKAMGGATVPIANAVAVPPNIVYMRADEAQQYANQERGYQRFVNQSEVVPGVMVDTIQTQAGRLPLVPVPGDSIGTYTAAVGGLTVADMYVLNDRFMSVPYLGSPSPTVLEIPPGVAGQLTRLSIIWLMAGLAVKSPLFSNKVRANQATS